MNYMVSIAMTLVFHSAIFFISLPLRIDFTLVLWILNIGGVVIIVLRLSIGRVFKPTLRFTPPDLFFVLLFLSALAGFTAIVIKWGEWDAWAIWSAHAKFLLSNSSWKNLWSPSYSWSHSDYPLMLPSLIAMTWKSLGEAGYLVPMIIGFLPFAGIITLLYMACKDPQTGIFSTLIIVTDKNVLFHAASQYADMLLAFFYLLFFVLLNAIRNDEKNSKTAYFILGIVASTGWWIKNEGLIFYLLSSVYVCYFCAGWSVGFRKFLIGSLPLLILLIVLHGMTTQKNDLISLFSNDFLRKIAEPSRYFLTIRYLLNVIIMQFPILLLALIPLFLARHSREFHPQNILIVLFIAYLAIYIVTPYDPEWHLRTSLNRLILQLYPSVIFFFSLALKRYSRDYSFSVVVFTLGDLTKSRSGDLFVA
jgi:hypothetical protein